MRYLALLRPEPVKSQPTASEFNWRAQMFADVHGLLKCPCFFIFPESYSSAAGSLSACAGGEGTKLEKKKSLHHRPHFQLDSFFSASSKIFMASKNSNDFISVSHCCDNIGAFKRTMSCLFQIFTSASSNQWSKKLSEVTYLALCLQPPKKPNNFSFLLPLMLCL